jgi:hypothetical protein
MFGGNRCSEEQARIEELEAQLNRERLEHAQEAQQLELKAQRMARDLQQANNRIAVLEFEVEQAHQTIYELNAQRGVRIKREKQVRELLREGVPKTRVARQVFGYGTGSAFDFVQRVIQETPALVNLQG